MDSGHNKKDTDSRTTRFSRTATRGGCPPESADVRHKGRIMTHKCFASQSCGMVARPPRVLALLLLTACLSNSHADLNSGLVAYYPFSGNANDISGHANNPSYLSSDLVADRYANAFHAMDFDINKYIEIPPSASLVFSNQMTISAWVNLRTFNGSDSSRQNSIVSTVNYTGWGGGFDFVIIGSGTNAANGLIALEGDFSSGTEPGGGPPHGIGYAYISGTNVWKHIVVVYSNQIQAFWIDGIPHSPASSTAFGNIGNANHPLRIGRRSGAPPNNNWFLGRIDDVRIYNRALTAGEISQLAAPLLGNEVYEQPVARIPDPSSPEKLPEYDNLVLITHGYQPLGALADVSWINNLADTIQARLTSQGMNTWLVYPFSWKEMAWPDPETALANGDLIGGLLGSRIGHQTWHHVHLIGHSAGSALIQSAAQKIKQYSPTCLSG
jgi:hypothetical protein